MRSLFPVVSLTPCTLREANDLLIAWGHTIGPVNRPTGFAHAHVLLHEDEPVAVATTHTAIRETVAGLQWLRRDNTVELSRMCAARPDMNRVMLRLWRAFVFPAFGVEFAISYQDADQHSGNLYRFDGWERVAYSRAGGTDTRSGRPGRNKWVWIWPRRPEE